MPGRGTRPPPGPAERGQATVELALLLPFVCGLLLLVAQLALVARSQILLHHVTRETARAVALDGDTGSALEAGRRATGLDPERLALTVEPAGAAGLFAVEGHYRLDVIVPLVDLLRREVTLDSRLVVRAEPAEPP